MYTYIYIYYSTHILNLLITRKKYSLHTKMKLHHESKMIRDASTVVFWAEETNSQNSGKMSNIYTSIPLYVVHTEMYAFTLQISVKPLCLY